MGVQVWVVGCKHAYCYSRLVSGDMGSNTGRVSAKMQSSFISGFPSLGGDPFVGGQTDGGSSIPAGVPSSMSSYYSPTSAIGPPSVAGSPALSSHSLVEISP